MFSKKLVLIVGTIVLVAVNVIVLSINSRPNAPITGIGRTVIYLVSPFQEAVSHTIRFAKDIWRHYFYLVSAAKENDRLLKSLQLEKEKNNRLKEMELSHKRLQRFLGFSEDLAEPVVAAEVIAKDPSPWFKTIMINKGSQEGLQRGMPVVMPEGVAGLVTDVSGHYAKVLLIIDQNSAVDAILQRTRARGIVKGDPSGALVLKYVLRKHDVRKGDTVISSGLDGVFPKGLRIGEVARVEKPNSGIFQEVLVTPFVHFETLEEVLIVLERPEPKKNFE